MSALEPLELGPDELGECPRWVLPEGELWRVDISAGEAHRVADPLAARPLTRSERFEGEVGFALPRAGGGMVVGVEQRVLLLAPGGERQVLLEVDEPEANRFNDALCDDRGRLWAGTFARDRRAGAANLYRIDPDGSVERVLDGLTISNGLGWLDDGQRLHFIDSPRQEVEVFDVDPEAGRLSGRRTLAPVRPADGSPDGLCVDAEEGTWVALFGGGAIRRYEPDGSLVAELSVPVPHVTAVCIGGSSEAELFATTTFHRLSPSERERQPLAGKVFHARVPVGGRRITPFAG